MHWNPSSIANRRNKNEILWNDMEKAYDFVEKYAPYRISGGIEGFILELYKKRWNAAIRNVVEAPNRINEYKINTQLVSVENIFSNYSEIGFKKTSIAELFYSPKADEIFKELVKKYSVENTSSENGRLFGYGTDGYGTYIPLHILWPNYQEFWGIYISENMMIELAIRLYTSSSMYSDLGSLNTRKLLDIAYQIILRHQLFHFKIEQWALVLELVTGKPYYLPYLANVYIPSLYEEDDTNLEEALANRSILNSKKIALMAGAEKYRIFSAIEHTFIQPQGPGYRNSDLKRGIPSHVIPEYRDVMNLLCNQISRGSLDPQPPLSPFYIYPPNNNFLRAENLVPIYVVPNIDPESSVMG